MLAYYYLYLAVVTLSVSIYNFDTAASAKQRVCFNIKQMNKEDYKKFITSQGKINENKSDPDYVALFNLHISTLIYNFNTTEVATKDGIYNVAEKQDNLYVIFQGLIAIFYIILTILSIIMAFLIAKLSNLVPDDFIDMSRFKRCGACICKSFPILIVVVHLLIFIFIVIVWGCYAAKHCINSASTLPGLIIAPIKYYDDTFALNLVTIIMWILIHYAGSIFKDAIYEEPFMYNDSSKKTFSYVMFKKLGP
jgi:hypothetical protein